MSNLPSPETTPRPSSIREVDPDRTPYIPRRKSSIGNRQGSADFDSTVRVVELDTTPKSLAVRKRGDWSSESVQTSEVESYSQPNQAKLLVTNANQHIAFGSQQRLSPHDQVSLSSNKSRKGHRVLSKLLSTFVHCGHPTAATSALVNSLNSDQGLGQRLSGSTAFTFDSRRSSLASGASTETSLVHPDPSLGSVDSNCENPLRVPPKQLLNLEQVPDSQIQRYLSGPSFSDEGMPPTVAAARMQTTLDTPQADVEKPAMVWIVIEITGFEHLANESGASPRSQAFGPPDTNAGCLANLRLEFSRAKGCNIVRVIGYEARESLFPDETWSVVVQVLVEPPVRRTPMKAFSVQTRTSYHMMSQLHGMLAPSEPIDQDLLTINLTFEHTLFPPSMQCALSSHTKVKRVHASILKFRPPYLRHRRKDYIPPQPEQALRDQRELVADKLLDLLETEFRGEWLLFSYTEATDLLGDFFDGFEGRVETRQRASRLLQALDESAGANAVGARGEERLRTDTRTARGRIMHAAAPSQSPSQSPSLFSSSTSPSKSPRKGMELSRENLRLQDITNQQHQRHQQWPSPSSRRQPMASLPPVPSPPPPPMPLFSPRKRASVAELPGRKQDFSQPQRGAGTESGSGSGRWSGGSRLHGGYRGVVGRSSGLCSDNLSSKALHPNAHRPESLRPAALRPAGLRTRKMPEKRRSSPTGAQVGSPRFYEDELDEANRIWKGMRESSCGSPDGGVLFGRERGDLAGEVEAAIGKGGEDLFLVEAGMKKGREVVGAPWL